MTQNYEKILDRKLDYIGQSNLYKYKENIYLVISYSWDRRKGELPYQETLIYSSDEYGNRLSPIPLKVWLKMMETSKAFEQYIKEL